MKNYFSLILIFSCVFANAQLNKKLDSKVKIDDKKVYKIQMVTCSNPYIDLGNVQEDFSTFNFELVNSFDKPITIKVSPSCGCIMNGMILEKSLSKQTINTNGQWNITLPPNQKYIFTAYYGIYRSGPFQKSITLISETPIFENNKKELRLFIKGNNTKVFK